MKTPSIELSANTKSTVISILNDKLAEGLDLAPGDQAGALEPQEGPHPYCRTPDA